MTAEMAILNKVAVALAADSAVTIRVPAGDGRFREKVYQTDKVFTLSKYAPVGIMVYADAQFLGIPWSTIIKMYREHLGERKFPYLHDYVRHFVEYVGSFAKEDIQRDHFVEFVSVLLKIFIVNVIDETVKRRIAENEEQTISDGEIFDIVTDQFDTVLDKLSKIPDLSDEFIVDGDRLRENYVEEIERSIKQAFGDLPLKEDSYAKLEDIIVQFFEKDYPWSTSSLIMASGIVICGFGEEDIFPCMHDFILQGVINNRARVVRFKTAEVSQTSEAIVKAFAQYEAVDALVIGVDSGYQKMINGWLITTFTEDYPSRLREHLQGLDPTTVECIIENVRAEGKTLVDAFHKKRQEYSREKLVDPMLTAISSLSKHELGEITESLVNLTSIKRRISLDTETVGGPIDVAVISKGDGFVWIRRKHYFDPKLNHHFFRNYFDDKQKINPVSENGIEF